MFAMWLLVLAAFAVRQGFGSTFHQQCMALPYPSAIIEDQCVVAIEAKCGNQKHRQDKCRALRTVLNSNGVLFSLEKRSHIGDMQKQFMLKKNGFYYGRNDVIISVKGAKMNKCVGYLCAIPLRYGCSRGWYPFESKCYLPVNVTMVQTQADIYCKEQRASMPKITNDEENRFVTWLAQTTLFKGIKGKSPFWGPLQLSDKTWRYLSSIGNEQNIEYMRWLPWRNWTETAEVKGSVIYAGNKNNYQKGVFGYWDQGNVNEPLKFICQRDADSLQ